MKISGLIPLLLISLSACTTPYKAPEATSFAAVVPTDIVAKNVLCIDLKPEALGAHAECAAASQTTDARCDEIRPEVLDTYQECRAVSLGAITLGAQPAPARSSQGTLPRDLTLTSESSSGDNPVGSGTVAIENGVRSTSVTINGTSFTLTRDTVFNDLPDWNSTQLPSHSQP